jgi:hypothetical protein
MPRIIRRSDSPDIDDRPSTRSAFFQMSFDARVLRRSAVAVEETGDVRLV